MPRVAVLAILLSGCTPVVRSTPAPSQTTSETRSAFSEKIAAGCHSETECVEMKAEAYRRTRACHEHDGPCDQERDDAIVATNNLAAWRAKHPAPVATIDHGRDDQEDNETVQAAEAEEQEAKTACRAKVKAKAEETGKKCKAMSSTPGECKILCFEPQKP